MYLLPFVKYLKPHAWRIAVAMFCMGLVSVLGVANILILIPPLRILFEQQGVGVEQIAPAEQLAELAAVPAQALAAENAGEAGGSSFSIIPAGVRDWWDDTVLQGKQDLENWFRRQADEDPHSVLYVLCGILLTLTFVKGLAGYLSNYLLAHTLYMVNLRMREDAYRSVLSQDYLYFTRHQPGYLISRINSDTNSIRGVFDKLIADGVQQPLNLIAYGGALVIISWRLSLLSAILIPVLGVILYFFSKSLRKITKKQKKKADQLTSSMTEALNNIWIVKAFGTEGEEIDKAIRIRMKIFKYMMQRRLVKFASGPLFEFLGALMACGVVLLGGYVILGDGWAWIGPLDVIGFGAFLYFLSKFYRPMKSLSKAVMKYQVARVSAERLLEIYALEPVVLESEDPKPFISLEKGIEFRDVWMTYGDKDILKGINLKIPRGKMVALVGETGSGKTTIANLLARLFDPTEGQIFFDDINLRDLKVADLRKRLGVVTQDTVLFEDSVANNITYGHTANGTEKKEVERRVKEAARTANADQFIRELEGGKGYKSDIGPSGSQLSGGQRQRIAIARALYGDPQIIIFDEATSALDSQTQALVQEAVQHVLEDRTSLVISHRLSTVRAADRIYVLDQGQIAEEGSFEELMKSGGEFYRLYQKEALAETVQSEPA